MAATARLCCSVWPGAFHGFATMIPQVAVSRAAVAALADWTD